MTAEAQGASVASMEVQVLDTGNQATLPGGSEVPPVSVREDLGSPGDSADAAVPGRAGESGAVAAVESVERESAGNGATVVMETATSAEPQGITQPIAAQVPDQGLPRQRSGGSNGRGEPEGAIIPSAPTTKPAPEEDVASSVVRHPLGAITVALATEIPDARMGAELVRRAPNDPREIRRRQLLEIDRRSASPEPAMAQEGVSSDASDRRET